MKLTMVFGNGGEILGRLRLQIDPLSEIIFIFDDVYRRQRELDSYLTRISVMPLDAETGEIERFGTIDKITTSDDETEWFDQLSDSNGISGQPGDIFISGFVRNSNQNLPLNCSEPRSISLVAFEHTNTIVARSCCCFFCSRGDK